jgi:hypothetical protein
MTPPLVCSDPWMAWTLICIAGLGFGGRLAGPPGAIIGGMGFPALFWIAFQAFPPCP